MKLKCILCLNETMLFKKIKEREFVQCTYCHSLMLTPESYVSLEKEKARYEEHNNDVMDQRYQAFVSPIVDEVLKDYHKTHLGLDFGSGTGPVITKLLRDKDYSVEIYDPFFANDQEKLKRTYDYIVSCEVIEHFHHPREEFQRLKSMLKPAGTLYLMTKLYEESINFDLWNYKNDPTHVFIYHKDALEYIKKTYGFTQMIIEKDLIIFRTK